MKTAILKALLFIISALLTYICLHAFDKPEPEPEEEEEREPCRHCRYYFFRKEDDPCSGCRKGDNFVKSEMEGQEWS